jgi:replicative DNA helicase
MAERHVLGAILRNNSVLAEVLPILSADCFRVDGHQRLFKAMVGLFERGEVIDLVTTADQLRGEIKDVGGYHFLAGLWELSPTGLGAVAYAKRIQEHFTRRQLLHAGQEIVHDAADGAGSASDLLEEADRRIFTIAQGRLADTLVDMPTALNEVQDEIDAGMSGQRPPFLETGFMDLDNKLGGLLPGELVVIGARPGIGKTCIGLGIARNLILRNQAVFFASLEQRRPELVKRLLCCEAEVDSFRLRKYSLDAAELHRLAQAVATYRGCKLFIDDAMNQNVLRIAANARRLKMQHAIGLVVIDYLQILQAEDSRAKRHEQVAAFSRRLKILARELEVPIVALAQLNRGPENREQKKPRLADLRESAGPEHDADIVILMHQPDSAGNEVELDVAKNRSGRTGGVSLLFRKAFHRFENYLPDLPQPFGE